METVDLHTHSNKSDGTLSPKELVQAAYDAGLSAVALTDHDTADGLKEAADEAARRVMQMPKSRHFEFIPGIELSVTYPRPQEKGSCPSKELHIVGLYLDTSGQAFKDALEQLRKNREARNHRMIEKMQADGIDITMESLRRHQGDGVLTRANFASYLMHIGVIDTIQEGFDKYLNPGKPFYVPRQYMDPKDAIALIHSVHGLAVLAHPLLYHFDDASLDTAIAVLSKLGLDGLETWYSMNRGYDLQRMKKLADKYGLVYSGGSDFHGANKPHIQIGRGRGDLFVPAEILDTQKQRLATI